MSNFKESMQQIVEPAIGPVMDMVSGIALDGLAGTLVPGTGNLILAYKQQRRIQN